MNSFCVLAFVFITVNGSPVIKDPENEILEFENYLETSRKDDGRTLEERMATNPKAKAWENSGKLQGDIVLDEEQIESLVGRASHTRKALIWPNTKWPQNTVVYEFANGHFTFRQRSAIVTGIDDITRNTCVRFRLRRAGDTHYVRITNLAGGCYANVGYSANHSVRTLNLANNCFTHTTIVHEWLHAIGFFHMQSTHNRDDYVRVVWQNIRRGMEHNFEKYSTDVVGNLGLPYEYASNMHYGRYSFSTNGRATIQPLYNDGGLMGQQEYITRTDWLRVNRHYNCPGA